MSQMLFSHQATFFNSLHQMNKEIKYMRFKCFPPIKPLFEIPKIETIWIKSQ